MKKTKKLMALAIVVSLTGCNSRPISSTVNIVQPNSTPSPSKIQQRAKSATSNLPEPSQKTTNVTFYTSDAECQKLIPQTASVSAKNPIKGAVGKVLQQQDTKDINLSGYRINVKNGIATIDLRKTPGAKREFASLSSCEQFALFGSLRKTLTSNTKWQIKEVKFTEEGKAIGP